MEKITYSPEEIVPCSLQDIKYQLNYENIMKIHNLRYLISPTEADYANDYVYRPNDDTLFLIKVLFREIEKQQMNHKSIVCELGCGSGICIASVIKKLQQIGYPPDIALAIDINIDACFLTDIIQSDNNLSIDVINMDIFKGVQTNYQNQFDIIICNPPYVPTENTELNSFLKLKKQKNQLLLSNLIEEAKKINLIDLSYAGGENGMEITQKMINQSVQMLSDQGAIYLFLIEENNINKIIDDLIDRLKLKYQILAKQTVQNEIQYVFKITKI